MELEFLLLWATLSLVYYVAISIIQRRSGSGRQLPPGPRPLPIVGNLFQLRGGNFHRTLARLARVHGPVTRLKVLSTNLVVVSSRAAVREAYARHDGGFAARSVPDAARALGWADHSMAWLPSSSPQWRRMRGVMAAHVTSSRSLGSAAACGVRERKVRDVVGYLRAREGQAVELRAVLYKSMLNLLSASLFSVDVAGGDSLTTSQPQGLPEDLHHVAEVIMKPNISDVLPFLKPLDLNGRRRVLATHLKKIFATLDNIIDARLLAKENKPRNDFLDTLLNLMSSGKVTRADVTHILFEVFGAGAETVATTVEWAMAELLRHPSVMSKTRAEVAGDKVIKERDAAGLPCIQAVLKESMRLHPVVPLLVHKVVEDGVEIGGYAVPQGSTLIFNSWAIMRDPDVWDSPDEFRPERFITCKEEVKYRGKDQFEFIPFGSGRRSCPGVPLVERVMPMMLASLLHAFEWRLPNGMSPEELDVTERFGTVTGMAVPLRVVPIISRT